MKLYILYREHDPYMYSDYPDSNDNWAVIHWIGTNVDGLVKYVNDSRIKAAKEFRECRPHRFDDNSDSLDFSWTSASCHILITETDKQVEIDVRDAFEEWSEGRDNYNLFTLEVFFKMNDLIMWHPSQEDIQEINKSIGQKDVDLKDKIEEYRKLKEELHYKGVLGQVDG